MYGHRGRSFRHLYILLVVLSVHCTLTNAFKYPPLARQFNDFAASSIVEVASAEDAAISYRLPNNTLPISYTIHLTTNVHRADFTFTGSVSIDVQVLTASSRSITLHKRELNIVSARLVRKNDAEQKPLLIKDPNYTEANELLNYSLHDDEPDLTVGARYILTIEFTGILSERLRGFYRSSYLADDGSIRWLAGTHFEPTNARHAFPCFDEPGLRATFQLTITHGAEYFAVSNMPVSASTLSTDGQTKTTAFEVTPSMPTYLNAFVVSDYASVSHTDANTGFTQKVYARSNAIAGAAFGLETGRRTLEAFTNRFNVNYTLPKLDQIAVPGFGGAMENWGLIIYAEDLLLFSDTEDTYVAKLEVVETIVHEIAHQWFGNRVTNKWWTFNWLNEGFATLFQNHGVDWLFPNWHWTENFVFAVVQNVMIEDATNVTRPISRYVESPAAISSNFDNMAYSKASCVLNMFMHAITSPIFMAGLTVYLNRHADSVAVEEDLFTAIQETVSLSNLQLPDGFTVAAAMSSWTRQSGFPLVDVQRNYSSGAISFTQQRYLSDPQRSKDLADNTAWWIPYNLATNSSALFNETRATHWLKPTRGTTVLQLDAKPRATDWLLVNKRQTGYYRVQYDAKNYDLLSTALRRDRTSIPVASRAQLIDDLLELAFSEWQSYETALYLLRYLEHETDYVPWASAVRGLVHVDRLQTGSPKITAYRAYIGKLLARLYNELGLHSQSNATDADEPIHRRQARQLAIEWACRYGNIRCQTDTGEILRRILSGNQTISAIPIDHRNVVLCAATRNVTASEYRQLWDLVFSFENASKPSRRHGLFAVLACSTNDTQLNWALSQALNPTNSNLWSWAERFKFYKLVADSQDGVSAAIDLFAKHLDLAVEKFGIGNVGVLLQTLAGRAINDELRVKTDALLAKADSVNSIEKNIIRKARNTIAQNRRWIARNRHVIDEWIRKNGCVSQTVATVLIVACAAFAYFI